MESGCDRVIGVVTLGNLAHYYNK